MMNVDEKYLRLHYMMGCRLVGLHLLLICKKCWQTVNAPCADFIIASLHIPGSGSDRQSLVASSCSHQEKYISNKNRFHPTTIFQKYVLTKDIYSSRQSLTGCFTLQFTRKIFYDKNISLKYLLCGQQRLDEVPRGRELLSLLKT